MDRPSLWRPCTTTKPARMETLVSGQETRLKSSRTVSGDMHCTACVCAPCVVCKSWVGLCGEAGGKHAYHLLSPTAYMQTGVWCAALWPFPLRRQVVVAVVVSLRVLGEHCGCACMSQGCAVSHGSVRTSDSGVALWRGAVMCGSTCILYYV